MRIRKRKVPLPLSLLSPVPLSDPHLFPVHHHQSHPSTSSSDLLPSIAVGKNNDGVKNEEEEDDDEAKQACLDFHGVGERALDETHTTNFNNNDKDEDDGRNHTKTTATATALPNAVIPLRKRRSSGSFLDVDDDDDDDDVRNGKKSKQKRGTTIMEGSRCSRVNGRGWRCYQPTLVGYSLCEHHLGKGRLRSMTAVRGRPSKSAHPKKQKQPPFNSKRASHKLGVVKARSLSSLLGQVSTTTTSSATTSSNKNMDVHVNMNANANLDVDNVDDVSIAMSV